MDDIAAFLAIVETGSQTAAAQQLRRSLQAVNRSLAALERSIGVQLIARTTRRSSPTETGLAFYRRVKPALAEIDDASIEALNRQAEPYGRLRIGAPTLFAHAHVVPAVCEFMTRYPRVEVELKVSDRKVDLLDEQLDLAVRIRDLPDSDLKARRIGELRMVFYGAPAYFQRRGRPRHPDELARHDCVLRTVDPDAESWPFRVSGRRRNVHVRGRFRTDSGAATHAAVAGGLGIGMAPLWQIRALVDDGSVELVLEDYETARTPIYAVLPPARTPPAKTRLFTDLLAARLKRARF